MEVIGVILGFAVAFGAYFGSKVYFDKVGKAYGYDINKSLTRFIPLLGWFAAFGLELAEMGNTPLEIGIIVLAAVIYGVIIYKKTNSVLHSVLVALINAVVSLLVFLFVILKICGEIAKSMSRGNNQ